MKFSIIIPAYNREKTIERCLRSVLNQTYDKTQYEIILIDDASTDRTVRVADSVCIGSPVRVHFEPFSENKGRVAARNRGLELATGEWICWLDSDDEYVSTYLETIADAIERYPDYQIFNFAAIVYDEQNFHSHVRHTFLPELRPDGGGHEQFKSGGIGTGSFVFAKEISELLPEARTPYGDSGSFAARATLRFPELESLYGRTESGQWRPLGNPWGDDYVMFFALTRNHISKPLDIALYLQHVRK